MTHVKVPLETCLMMQRHVALLDEVQRVLQAELCPISTCGLSMLQQKQRKGRTVRNEK